MIETYLIYTIIGCIAYVIYDMKRIKKDTVIERSEDEVIRYIAGKPMLVWKD